MVLPLFFLISNALPIQFLMKHKLVTHIRLLLLFAAGCNAAAFHARGSLNRLDLTARAQMLASVVIWLAVIACGRWIAYQ